MWRDVLVLTVGSVLGRTVPGPWLEGPDHGEVHYYYHRHFLVPQPYWAPPLQGYSVKQGDHFSDKILGVTHGHHHEDKSPSHHPGYVPVYGRHGYDISYGVSHGRDLLGSFSHFTGPYGPFGFWANLFHDRK